MRSWFATSSTTITLIVKTADGHLEDQIQIQSDQSVYQLKVAIDETFDCDPAQQQLIFDGEELNDEQLLSAYKITDNSTILITHSHRSHNNPIHKPKRRNKLHKSNAFHSPQASQPGITSPQHKDNNPKYFDPILNKLAQYHPSLPLAVMENAQPISELMSELTAKFDVENQKLNEQQQSLTAYYYYLSLASLSAATKTVASSVYQRLPSKDEISSSIQSIMTKNETDPGTSPNIEASRASLSWLQHLQNLVRNTKEEKAAIDRLVLLGFSRRESVEAYLACDKDEAFAALFMSQNRTETKGNHEEKENISVDASIGYLADGINDAMNINPVFQQFQIWMRGIFDDDELFYKYVLLFMRERIALMSCLEDLDGDDEFFIHIGIEHKIHRKKILAAIKAFVDNKHKLEMWWNETIQFKKYLQLFQKSFGIWDLEELLLQIRNKEDILEIIGEKNKYDVDSIWKHISRLRQSHSLYSDVKMIANTDINTQHPYNPNVVQYPPNNMNYSAPIADYDDAEANNEAQKEGAITQI